MPWKDIIKSPAVWSIIVLGVSNNFGNYTLLTDLPTFMTDVLNYKIEEVLYQTKTG